MADPFRSEMIKKYPIGRRLDAFREAFSSNYAGLNVHESPDAVQHLNDEALKNLALDLLLALQSFPLSRHLPSSDRRGTLLLDLARLIPLLDDTDKFDIKSLLRLLNEVIGNASDEAILDALYDLITESTPPPRQLPYPHQTPISFSTGSLVNTSENRKYVDAALKNELDSSLYIDVPGFFDAFFGKVANLKSVTDAVFRKCQEGKDPLYLEEGGWRDWPKDAKEEQVLKWLKNLIDKFLEFTKGSESVPNIQRRPFGQPSQALLGSTNQRKLDVGFANDTRISKHVLYDWSQILIPGELKSNPKEDKYTSTWLDLARYAREVLTAQDARRFVLGFTLCGSVMRLWEFDRLGGIASSPFDINTRGQQFVSAILGYLWMTNEQLGFDPTILEDGGSRYMTITRNGEPERLVINERMKRHASVAGRATTCWKAYREGDKSKQILVIKDSWQYPEREEEGELLREATEKGVVNVARYYYHETVHVGGSVDDVNGNVRNGLDIMKASNAFRIASASKAESKIRPPITSGAFIESLQRSKSKSTARKRSSSSLNAPLPSSKRARSSSSHKQGETQTTRNRVHRRVILCDYGRNIHKASSRSAMLAALEGSIAGHESLREKTGIIQCDISTGNLMINEAEENPSWNSFLIDLDLAIREQRQNPSGAPNKTGTRAFMAIGALYGEKRTFMHDLESFFWVLFWICIHYTGPDGASREVRRFEKWNYTDTTELAVIKKGEIGDERDFIRLANDNFSSYYQPLIPWVNKLRRVVFPNNRRWDHEDQGLYSQMRKVLQEAIEDPDVLAE